MTMKHDITHCKGGKCPMKETCYRYLAYLDLIENKEKQGIHSYFISPPYNYGKCQHYYGE